MGDICHQLRRGQLQHIQHLVGDQAGRTLQGLDNLVGGQDDLPGKASFQITTLDTHGEGLRPLPDAADRNFHVFGGVAANDQAVMLAHIFDDSFVKGDARHLDGSGGSNAVHAQNADVRRAAADVHHHAALRRADVQIGTQSGSQRFLNQIDTPRTGLRCRLNDSTFLNLGDAAGNADDHTGLDHRVLHDAPEHLRKHPRCQLIVGNHAVLHGVDGHHIARRSAQHIPRSSAYLQDLSRVLIQCDHGRLAQHNALSRRINENVGSAQVDSQVFGKQKHTVTYCFFLFPGAWSPPERHTPPPRRRRFSESCCTQSASRR